MFNLISDVKSRALAMCLSAGLLSACSQAPVDEINGEGIPTTGEIPAGTVIVEPFPNMPDVVIGNPIPAPSIPNYGGVVSNPGFHVVQPSEGLYRIATQYGLNYKEVGRWNGIPAPYNLSPGQQLRLTPPSDIFMDVPVATTPVYSAPVYSAPATSSSFHTVARGETLYAISRLYGVTVSNLAQMNGIYPPYSLNVGQQLSVGSQGSAVTATPYAAPASAVQYHLVQRGDTLYSISRRYGMSVPQIASMNSLRQPYTLSVGQQLQIMGGGLSSASATMCNCR